MNRAELSARYAPTGPGIEIGPGSSPWPCSWRPVYVCDRPPLTGWLKADRTEDGGTLPSFEPGTQAAILASHVLEHIPDPIGAIKRWVSLLKPGGAILAAVPEKVRTFDVNRHVTPYSLHRRIHKGGVPAQMAFAACQWADWLSRHDGKGWAESVEGAVAAAGKIGENVHYNVWDWQALRYLLDRVIVDYELPIRVAEFELVGSEVLFVLVRNP